jgi:hypothetical protein
MYRRHNRRPGDSFRSAGAPSLSSSKVPEQGHDSSTIPAIMRQHATGELHTRKEKPPI